MTLYINHSPGVAIKHSPRIIPEPEGPPAASRQMVLFQGWEMWSSAATCKAYIDSIIHTLDGLATDLVPLVIQYYVTQYQLWGESTLARHTSTTIEGHTPLGYCIEHAHAHGMKVNAWFVFMYSDAWCGTKSFLLDPQPDTLSYRTSDGIILYSVASTRTKMANCLADFYTQNPGLDGIHLDYIRTNGNIYQDPNDITTFVHLVRDTVNPACDIGFYSLANPQALTGTTQDGKTWVENDYVDYTLAMAYEYNFGRRWEYLVDLSSKPIYFGLSPDECETSQSGYKARLAAFSLRGFPDHMHFQWTSDGLHELPNNAVTALSNHLAGADPPSMGNVTKISVNWTAGGSISYTIGGVVRTVSYETGSGWTTNKEWKDYLEGLYGEIPYLFFYYIDSACVRVMLGDTWHSF